MFLPLRLAANKKKLVWILFLASFTALVAAGAVPLRYPESALDPAWQQALVDATDKGRVFGSDIIFTYGPFHQAVNNQASDHLSILLISRVLFTFLWFGIVTLAYLNVGMSAAIAIALSVCLVSVWDAGAPGDAKFYLMFLIAIIAAHSTWLANHKEHPFLQRSIQTALLATGISLTTFVKLSYIGAAIPALTAIYGFMLLDLLEHPTKRSIFLYISSLALPLVILYITWGFIVSWSPHTMLNYYTGLNFDIVSGYSDAMSLEASRASRILISLYWIAILVNLILYRLLFSRPGSRRTRFPCLLQPDITFAISLITLVSWVVFKAAFVRDDAHHILIAGMYLFSFIIILAGFRWDSFCLLLRNNSKSLFLLSILPAASISYIIAVVEGGYRPPMLIDNLVLGLSDNLLLISGKGKESIAGIRRDKFKSIRAQTEDYKIPPGSTADIIPWKVTNLLANQLLYKPRPVPHSYSVYTKALQKINSEFFNSINSPEYVILDAWDIDGRLQVGLDSAALASIRTNYAFSHRGTENSLVFKRNNRLVGNGLAGANQICQVNGQELTWSPSDRSNWHSNIVSIPSDRVGHVVMTINFESSPTRSLLSTIYRPYPLMIDYLDSQHNVVEKFRFIPKAGHQMVIYPIIRNNDDLLAFMNSEKVNSKTSSGKISSLRFSTKNLGAPFKVSNYSLKFSC